VRHVLAIQPYFKGGDTLAGWKWFPEKKLRTEGTISRCREGEDLARQKQDRGDLASGSEEEEISKRAEIGVTVNTHPGELPLRRVSGEPYFAG